MRLICRLHFGLWLFVLVLSMSHCLRLTLVPIPGLINPDIHIHIEPACEKAWMTALFMGTMMAALLVFVAEQVETELTALRQAQVASRSTAQFAPPAELFQLRQAIRSGDIPAIHDLATWRALAYADGETLSPYELAVLYDNEDVIRTMRKAYQRHRLAYRLEFSANQT